MFKKIVSVLMVIPLALLTGCSSSSDGLTGGVVNGIVQQGVYEACNDGNPTAVGKVMKIDGVELKLPVDWNYAHSRQPDFDGGNWNGDDAARGIGIFNCNEEGDKTQAFADAYAVNIRWEYKRYGFKTGVYPQHASYKGKDSTGKIEVGGTDASCTDGGGIIDGRNSPNSAKEAEAIPKAKVLVYNPKTRKACVCAPGYYALGKDYKATGHPINWGGAPLSLLGGITTAVSNAIGAEQNKSVLELFFVDESTPLGPCEYGGATGSDVMMSNVQDGCEDTFVDASSAADLAVSASFCKDEHNFPGHIAIKGNRNNFTTELAIKLRELTAGDKVTDDCGMFVSSVVRATMDKDYPPAGTMVQGPYMERETEKYELICKGTESEIKANHYDKLKPGDIFVNYPNHTYMFVGKEAIQKQYGDLAKGRDGVSASLNGWGPAIFQIGSDNRLYHVYRFKGNKNPVPGVLDKL